MMVMLLYIVIAIMAFVFGITTGNTITKEAGVIGTLRASGYTGNELIRHYMTLPVLVTLAGALAGNVLILCSKTYVRECTMEATAFRPM